MSSTNPHAIEQVLEVTKVAQLLALVKENQLVTALVCFLLWQIGALTTAQSYASGVMC
jgi:hypothetical protein